MTEISSKFSPQEVEQKWYQHWMQNGFFDSNPDGREPYTIVIPPPNVTGVLHMGHMLNNTIQDVLIRRARMQGKNACWVPGTDHASIATEAKVVAMLKEKGIEKSSISREEFLAHAWEWKEKYGGIILEQLKKLGASCDWRRTKFTMDPKLSDAVIDTFIQLYNKGLIYRGVRMVNWDPKGMTAVSDEEVIHREVQSKLYFIAYEIEGEETKVVIATTRPETLLGDTAVCVHPEDIRYKSLVGKRCIIPFTGRTVPIIQDEYVDKEFGTGCLKVTPAHDVNDYLLGQKHNLETIDILFDNGHINSPTTPYHDLDGIVARKRIVKDLEALGQLVKVEDIKNKVGYSERTDAVIEPKLSMQWFCDMEKMSKPALDVVLENKVKLVPEKFKNTYKHWMENVHDWCISRQLWWGQRIPAWYSTDGRIVVAKTDVEALALFNQNESQNAITLADIKQDEDVMDTWFSSWLWPISVFDGFENPDNADIKYYYPTQDLVTAPEILFFWVARMIIAGIEFKHEIPFSTVYLTGIVRDKLGRKMSKSLGNSPDPLDLIQQFGADGVRMGMLLCSPAGNDILFDESQVEQGRNFANKLWNAFRLVKGWQVDEQLEQPSLNLTASNWIQEKLHITIATTEKYYSEYRLSDAMMTLYKFIWDDFCSWYLEMIKPVYGSPIDRKSYQEAIGMLENIVKLLHPIMPFITEEIWQALGTRTLAESLIVAEYPKYDEKKVATALSSKAEMAFGIIAEVRNIRSKRGMSPKEALSLMIKTGSKENYGDFLEVMKKLGNLTTIEFVETAPPSSVSFLIEKDECFVPLEMNDQDAAAEKQRIKEEMEYLEGFMKSVQTKLGNERFVANAKPEIVENERKKMADAESKLNTLRDSLAKLNG